MPDGSIDMGSFLAYWGPAAVVLLMLGIIVRWFMQFIEQQAIRIERMTDSFNQTIQVYMTEGQDATLQLRLAISELRKQLGAAEKTGDTNG